MVGYILGFYTNNDTFFQYTDNANIKVSAMLTQLSWSCHLLIMSGCKADEEREFYIRLAIKERYTYRELERQMDSGYYESVGFRLYDRKQNETESAYAGDYLYYEIVLRGYEEIGKEVRI